MLDTEPTTESASPTDSAAKTPTPRTRRRAAARPAGPPVAAEAVEKPVKKTAKTTKKATKKTAKKAADTSADDTAEPAKKTTKTTKKATKKTAKKAATDTSADDVAGPASDSPGDQAPTKKSSRSRKKPPTVLFQPPEAEAAAAAAREAERADGGEAATDGDDDSDEPGGKRRRRRGGRGRRSRGKGEATEAGAQPAGDDDDAESGDVAAGESGESGEESSSTSSRRRRRRRKRGGGSEAADGGGDDPTRTVVHVRETRKRDAEISGVKGSTRLEAKKQRRREGREQGRRRPPVLTESEFLARREAVDRVMVIRQQDERTQIGVLEDDVLVEHYVAASSASTMVGTVYLGKVQNVLPSMEAAFVDVGRGRNAVLYAGEVNWDAAGLDGQPRRIEHALKSGDSVMVQVTKDPIGHKGARLTSQVSLPGRYLVYVPDGSMTGISRKLPDTERSRLKAILKRIVPDDAGVIVRTAAEGASEEELQRDVERLTAQWQSITDKAATASAPEQLYAEPDLTVRVVRDIFNEDFSQVVVSGDQAWPVVQEYVEHVAPDLVPRLARWTESGDVFAAHRIDEQLAKALDRKVWLPSGGYLIIEPTEAMTVIDVNTGKFTGSGGNLEQTVTKNNIEAAEEIVRQLRLRDVGGIIVVDFIDMVLESNRELVLRRLVECLGRDRTKHQVAEVTSLGLVQMTRKRVGQGLLDSFSSTCETCSGRGRLVQMEPVEPKKDGKKGEASGRRRRGAASTPVRDPELEAKEAAAKAALIKVAAATEAAKAGAEAHPADEESLPAQPSTSDAESASAAAEAETSSPLV